MGFEELQSSICCKNHVKNCAGISIMNQVTIFSVTWNKSYRSLQLQISNALKTQNPNLHRETFNRPVNSVSLLPKNTVSRAPPTQVSAHDFPHYLPPNTVSAKHESYTFPSIAQARSQTTKPLPTTKSTVQSPALKTMHTASPSLQMVNHSLVSQLQQI
jgi:hypothetical protein